MTLMIIVLVGLAIDRGPCLFGHPYSPMQGDSLTREGVDVAGTGIEPVRLNVLVLANIIGRESINRAV
jgi:hypothetical protein